MFDSALKTSCVVCELLGQDALQCSVAAAGTEGGVGLREMCGTGCPVCPEARDLGSTAWRKHAPLP